VNGRDRGSGSVLAVALIAAVVALTALALPLYMGLATRQAVAAAADAAALAAADVASGLQPGYPCTAAERAATANRTSLAACAVDGLIATVTVSRSILGTAVVATATAGPPDSGEGRPRSASVAEVHEFPNGRVLMLLNEHVPFEPTHGALPGESQVCAVEAHGSGNHTLDARG
jgi:secretion/DNA translocation related TadE-like protein